MPGSVLNDTAFAGNTTRVGGSAELLVENPKCLGCGSDLATRRRQRYITTSLTTGKRLETEVYECRCSRRRFIRREVTR